jgi:hypothetical protein
MAIQTIQGVVASLGVIEGFGVITTCWANAEAGTRISSRVDAAVAATVNDVLSRAEPTTRRILPADLCPTDRAAALVTRTGHDAIPFERPRLRTP